MIRCPRTRIRLTTVTAYCPNRITVPLLAEGLTDALGRIPVQ